MATETWDDPHPGFTDPGGNDPRVVDTRMVRNAAAKRQGVPLFLLGLTVEGAKAAYVNGEMEIDEFERTVGMLLQGEND